jgi:AraC-like DNA-binding protein
LKPASRESIITDIEHVGRLIISGSEPPVPVEYFRLIVVRQGAVRFSQEMQRKIVLPRSAILVPPGASRSIEAGGDAKLATVAFCRSVLDPEMLGEAADGIYAMIGSARGPAAPQPSIGVTRLAPAAFEEACALLTRIDVEGRQRRPGREIMQRLVLVELLMVVYRCLQSGSEAENVGRARFRIEDAVDYIRDRYAEELSLPDIAAHFGLNPSYLSRLFTRHTGKHLFEYLNTLRIQKSCLLLKRSSMSIVEIAFSVGYNNLSHFNRYFRRVMVMSPREFRNRSVK